MKLNFFTITAIVFAVLTGIIYFLSATTALNMGLLLVGNAFIMVVTVVSFSMLSKAARNSNPNVFVRATMVSILARLFLFGLAMLGVIMYFKKDLNKVNVFFLMIMYIIYSMVEYKNIFALSKKINNQNAK